jgi:FtsH-binding integral membrane protein
MGKLWRKYLALLDTEFTTQVFDNIKNLLVCALLFAAGTNALHSEHHLYMGLMASNVAGWVLIAVSALLMLLNVSDGIRRLSRLRYHTAFQILLFLIYLVLAVRVVEIVWDFRA